MFNKVRYTLFFTILLSVLFVYQNCAKVDGEISFGSGCEAGEGICAQGNPNNLKLFANLSNLQIVANPPEGIDNILIVGSCSKGGFDQATVRVQIRNYNGVSVFYKTTICNSEGLFEIKGRTNGTSQDGSLSVTTHTIEMDIFARDTYYNEVHGPNSYLTATFIPREVTKAPILISIEDNNNKDFWTTSSTRPWIIYNFDEQKSTVSLPHIQGLCDYKSGSDENNIYLKFSVFGHEQKNLIRATTIPCMSISGASNYIKTLANQNGGRTGYFNASDVEIPFQYGQGCLVEVPQGGSCPPFGRFMNRAGNLIVEINAVAPGGTIASFSSKPVIFNFKNSKYGGKGWVINVLLESLKVVKKAFIFDAFSEIELENKAVLNNEEIVSAQNIIEPSFSMQNPVDGGATTYTFGTRLWIMKYLGLPLLNNVEGTYEYPILADGKKVQIFGSVASKMRFKDMASPTGDFCMRGASFPNDPIVGVGDSTAQSLEAKRIALCLIFRYYNGLYAEPFSKTVKYVQNGVDCAGTNEKFLSYTGSDKPNCSTIRSFYNFINTAYGKFLTSGGTLANLSTDNDGNKRLKYFSNAVTQNYVNQIMLVLAYRNWDYPGGENGIFGTILKRLNSNLSAEDRRSLYPLEINYDGATLFDLMKGATRPTGSIDADITKGTYP